MLIHAPVSLGELIDKITILEIKNEEIEDPGKLANVRRELDYLNEILAKFWNDEMAPLKQKLREVNHKLWRIEDDIRLKEKASAFDDGFIALARSVYVTNDERARVKHEINTRFGSTLVEEKSYA